MRAFYFGCYEIPGHHLHHPNMQSASYSALVDVIGHIDSVYCPKDSEVEGRALVHYVKGWTILAFWDRSVDKRPGCNSNFIFEGRLSPPKALEKARKTFPAIFKRFSFPVQIISAADAVGDETT